MSVPPQELDDARVGRSRRVLAVVAIAAVVAGAIALAVAREPASAPAATAAPVVAVPDASADSVTWFCAAGTANVGGRADETVVISNVGDAEARARVTVRNGADPAPPVVRDFVVPARAQQRVKVSDLALVAEPAVTVEGRGGRIAVEHVLTGVDDVAAGPCARRASTEWYFPAGTTAKGYEQYLAVFNPYPDEAVIDVTFLTEEGLKVPEQLSGLSVAPRSRVTIPVHEQVRRNDITAGIVRARSGRVVAERTLIADGTDGVSGLALSLGVPSRQRTFSLPESVKRDGNSDRVIVMNTSDEDAKLETLVELRNELSFAPVPTIVPARTATVLRLPEGVPDDVPYSLAVRVTDGPPVALEQFVARTASPRSIATVEGEPTATARWIVPAARVGADDAVVIVNRGDATVQATISVVGDGDQRVLERIEVPKNRSVDVALADRNVADTDSLLVTANGPVSVFAFGRGGATRAPAIPFVAG